MKKLALTLLLVFSLVACSPKFSYFSTETTCPQCVVDSLLGPRSTNYFTWTSMTTVGVYGKDSTQITTYVQAVDDLSISVTTYRGIETSTVKKKKVK